MVRKHQTLEIPGSMLSHRPGMTDKLKGPDPMQYRQLGRSGLKISPICLGTMMFGGPTDEATSTRIVAKAREAGVNFIDTADAYSNGNSEAGGRPRHLQQPAQLGARDQARQPHGRRSQSRRPVAALGAAGRRRKPEAARHRLHRHLLSAQGRPFDAAGGDRARDGRTDPAGQGALFRRLELPRLAGRRNLQHLRRPRHRPPDRQPALLQRDEPHARGRALPGLRLLRPRHRAL